MATIVGSAAVKKDFDKFTLVGSKNGEVNVLINLFGHGSSNRETLLQRLNAHVSKAKVVGNDGKGKSKFKLISGDAVDLGFINVLDGSTPVLNDVSLSWELHKNYVLQGGTLEEDTL